MQLQAPNPTTRQTIARRWTQLQPVVTRALGAALIVGAMLLMSGCEGGRIDTSAPRHDTTAPDAVFEGPVERADCGPGSLPETDIQGRVSMEDRVGGRSQQGYSCNLELVGQHQGKGASWQMAWYEDCAYYGTAFPGGAGTQVLDVSDPTSPRNTAALMTPAMLDPWESLKVNERRGLLGADAGWNVGGPVFFDVYDLKQDCAQPQLLSSTPTQTPIGHEGEWAPDGLTYYVGLAHSAIDVSNPSLPLPIPQTDTLGSLHGLSLNEDGTRMYAVSIGQIAPGSCGNGLVIYDTTAVQNRQPNPPMPVIGQVCWEDGSTAQHTIPVFYDGKPYVLFVDEGGVGGFYGPAGAARFIDISDETQPRVVSKMKLEIQMPEHADIQLSDTEGNGIFGYQAHYCSVDRKINPTALACGYFQSGIRVFDIRDPHHPREIAYYNPPAQVGKAEQLPSSEHVNGLQQDNNNLTADWCSAQVRLIPERGELWSTCQDNGFMVLRFTNGVWPFE